MNLFSENLTEIELVKLYRMEKSAKKKSKIFNTLLFEKGSGGRSWHDNIKSHINKNRHRLNYYDCSIDVDDLYQEILQWFLKAVDRWFDLKSKFGFSTYIWYVVNSAVDRVFQSFRTYKRNLKEFDCLEVNEMYGDNKKISDVITDKNFGVYRTVDKKDSFEQVVFYNDLINFIKESFKLEEIYESPSLKNDLMKLIHDKLANDSMLKNLAIKYDKTQEEIIKLKQKLTSNLEKQMFNDIILFIENGIKDDGILASKYNCSRSQITKVKQKLNEVSKNKLQKVNLTVEECF